jgi:hypothetical protein
MNKTKEKIDFSRLNASVMTTARVDDINRRDNLGMKIAQSEKIWFSNMKGVRKPNVTFAMSDDELREYVRCKRSVHYFAENYCKIKREDSTIGEIKLRDYQVDMINLFNDNRFSILMASRQTGKCVSMKSFVYIQSDDKIIKLTLGELYYDIIKKHRNLTILENIKYYLYKILSRL